MSLVSVVKKLGALSPVERRALAATATLKASDAELAQAGPAARYWLLRALVAREIAAAPLGDESDAAMKRLFEYDPAMLEGLGAARDRFTALGKRLAAILPDADAFKGWSWLAQGEKADIALELAGTMARAVQLPAPAMLSYEDGPPHYDLTARRLTLPDIAWGKPEAMVGALAAALAAGDLDSRAAAESATSPAERQGLLIWRELAALPDSQNAPRTSFLARIGFQAGAQFRQALRARQTPPKGPSL